MKLDEMKAEFQRLTTALGQHLPATETQYLYSLIEEGVFLNINMLEGICSQEHEVSQEPTQALSVDDIRMIHEELFEDQDALNTTIQLALDDITNKSGQKREVISICKQIESLATEGMARLEELLKQSREDKQPLSSKPKP